PDRHPRRDRERQREPSNPLQPEGTARGDPRAAGETRARRLRLRHADRRLPADDPDRMGNPEATCERSRTEAREGGSGMESPTVAAHRSAVARPPARRRMPALGRWRRHPDHPADARSREHPADTAVPERDRRRTQTRTGGELEQPGPTASTAVRLRPCFSDGLSPICPRKMRKVAPRAGLEPATLRLAAGCSAIELPRNRWEPERETVSVA